MTASANITTSTTPIATQKLLDPQTGRLVVAPQPTGGQGLALNARGKVPLKTRKKLPGYEFGYDQITGSVTVVSTTEATGTAIISATAHPFDGEAVYVEFYCAAVVLASSGDVIASLFEGSTQVARLVEFESTTAGAPPVSSIVGLYRFTPTAGYHTYTVTAFNANGGASNASFRAGGGGASGYAPAFIRFTKV